MPPERWLRDVFVQGRARDMSMRGVIDALRRATDTVRLRAVVLHAIADQRTGIRRELEDDYGFEATGVSTDMLGNGYRPSEIGEADLIVSTPAYEPLARRLAAQHGKPWIIADVRSDLIPAASGGCCCANPCTLSFATCSSGPRSSPSSPTRRARRICECSSWAR